MKVGDDVEILKDIPPLHLKRGDRGTILSLFEDGTCNVRMHKSKPPLFIRQERLTPIEPEPEYLVVGQHVTLLKPVEKYNAGALGQIIMVSPETGNLRLKMESDGQELGVGRQMVKLAETDGDLLKRMGLNAELWAKECSTRFGYDQERLLPWFASAIEAGRSTAIEPAKISKELEETTELILDSASLIAWAMEQAPGNLEWTQYVASGLDQLRSLVQMCNMLTGTRPEDVYEGKDFVDLYKAIADRAIKVLDADSLRRDSGFESSDTDSGGNERSASD